MILIVRHGRKRGRDTPYMQPLLEYLRRQDPGLYAQLRLFETGGKQPALDGIRTVVFWLADPLRERYRACFEEADQIASRARGRGIPLINPPEALSNTIKSVQSARWRKAGIPTPEVRRFSNMGEYREHIARSSYPLFVRSDEEHSQRHMHLCLTQREAEGLPPRRIRLPGSVTPHVDIRAGFRSIQPGSIMARYYHKKRAVVLGRTVRTEEMFFSNNPIVSSETCTFKYYWGLPSRIGLHFPVREEDRPLVQADVEYSLEGSEHEELFRRAVKVLGLGFAAIDYSELADGGVVLWEANPYFFLAPVRNMFLPRQRRLAERRIRLFETIVEFLREVNRK